MDVQVAKAGGKARLLGGGDGLVAEEQHLVTKQGVLDGIAHLVADVAGKVHAADLCAQRRAEWGNGQAHVGLFRQAPLRAHER